MSNSLRKPRTTASKAATEAAPANPNPQVPNPKVPAAAPKTEPKELPQPYALVDSESVPVPYYRPVVRVLTTNADGSESTELLECPHTRYLHENEKTAMACGRRLAAQRGIRIGSDQ
ncbi:hypothetical protein [Kribbella italica]|uniref:Uncharacterized protein n=1 Tax=Kribbella italica TaxID=1540520 RepID=A0A7W9J2H0_9ACTN|nr:hypothetical protein [Kribbella italica]MBB5834383.1 hypothetical protein [Kribbella italica]